MKKVCLVVTLLIYFQAAFMQCPTNIDFETGDVSNWDCFAGKTSSANGINYITLAPSSPIPGRHQITTTASGNDPYGGFPQLCPYGGNYSVKLGNDSIGYGAEGMSYTFTVPNNVDVFSLTYCYAVVLQNPNHSSFEQPRFFVSAYDVLTGVQISCASYNFVATANLPGFQKSAKDASVLYKTWSPVSLKLSGMANRLVRLEFKTADCTLGGHFGYAYFDVVAGCSNVLATAPYCIETNSVVLNAPYGFQSYTWFTSDYSTVLGNQQSVTLSPPPPLSDTFRVDMEPFPGFGCRDTALAVVKPISVPDTPVAKTEYAYCQFDNATVLSAKSLPDHELLWYTVPTGGTGSNILPTPSTILPGVLDFYVSQKKLFGCESFRRKVSVDITPMPVPSFAINNSRQCEGSNQFIFTNTSTNLGNPVYAWSFGDGPAYDSSGADTSHSYVGYGNFNVKMKVMNLPTCTREIMQMITVVPKPLASFTYPPVMCEKQTAVNLVDNSSVPNAMSTLNKWWWAMDSITASGQNPAPFVPSTPGQIPVKQVVTTVEGCRSDTNTAFIYIHYRPNAIFGHSEPLCDNELTTFNNHSSMPQESSPEFIARWYWEFDNGSVSASKNPTLGFAYGQHHAKLIAESNFGCKSAQADSVFFTNAKPTVGIDINDSCVYRVINYKAVDLSNTVNKWYWVLENGARKEGSVVTRRFSIEGDYPLTLIGQTIEGCSDTLYRPFTIYDNKAFAGMDTVVAMNQPVQLNAHGGVHVQYKWSPATGLNDATIEAPLATLDRNQLYTLDAMSDKGCDSHSKILITRYKGPDIYIPNAFTPNGDGHNDELRIMPIGMKTFNYMAVYNRYGRLMYKTTNKYKGWDGTYGDKPQESGLYVVVAQGIDYNGNTMVRKISVLLIR